MKNFKHYESEAVASSSTVARESSRIESEWRSGAAHKDSSIPFVYEGAIDVPTESLKLIMGKQEQSNVEKGIHIASLSRKLISAVRAGDMEEAARIKTELEPLRRKPRDVTLH